MANMHCTDTLVGRNLPAEEANDMTFVITGVSGRTGAVAANTLLDQGQRVRVVVREQSKAATFAARGAEVAVADLGDPVGLARAFEGASGAYVLIPPDLATADYRAHQQRISRSIVDAASRANLPHLVLLSSIAAERERGNGPIAGLHELENMLRALPETHSTFIRAAAFMENYATSLGMLEQGVLPSFTPAALAYEMIATVDIGKLAAAVLLEGARETSVIELGGGTYSPDDAAAALSDVLGRPIRVAEAPLEAVVPTLTGFGMQPQLAGLYLEMTTAISRGELNFEGGHRRVQGATPLRTVLAGLLGRA
ncbi:MAG: NmrA family NAD(P)-binding protein [Deltaproteobacteria bacterium]|nr:NmrA family NAD(P)-binding protein [Nannocystaceae bacterium]